MNVGVEEVENEILMKMTNVKTDVKDLISSRQLVLDSIIYSCIIFHIFNNTNHFILSSCRRQVSNKIRANICGCWD